MHDVIEAFRDGGWGMYPTLAFGLVLVAIAIRYAVTPRTREVPLLIALSVLTFTSGALGFVSGLIATAHGLARETDDHFSSKIPFLGFGESLNNIAFALALITMAALAVSYGTWRTARDHELNATT